ncbi:hypothetical protein ACPOL_7097 (plasmid) [Acidisarcina polymorpha]|uniref:Recombinase domain-containing protein n=1 Tax=Acidisarcina polymorpha TaxID=2211140 RepID=A0A2Z5GBB2_9BACT|nr:recombinase family protein [Acidisarcina polymorpha]AXC16289.1 hypothetical protein ACPOL_7097 [Acidisarcina polymorpha]
MGTRPASTPAKREQNGNLVQPAPQVIELMRQYRAEGKTYRDIVAQLDALQIQTPRGCKWHPQTIHEILNRSQQEQT